MTTLDAGKSGQFKIGGDLQVNRLGFGAMRITGDGIWGEPKDRAEVIRTLQRLPEVGVNFVDTADSYVPDISEKLIHEALHPYKGHAGRDQGWARAARTGQLGAEWTTRLSGRR